MKIQTLTKAEEQVMQYVWKIEKGFLKDILDLFPEPKPHTNTVSTILKVCLLYTSPSPRDAQLSRMPSSA